MRSTEERKEDDSALAIYHNIASSLAVLNTEILLATQLYIRLGGMFITIIVILSLIFMHQITGHSIYAIVALTTSVLSIIFAIFVLFKDYSNIVKTKYLRKSIILDLSHLSRSIPIINPGTSDYSSSSEEARIRVIQEQIRILNEIGRDII